MKAQFNAVDEKEAELIRAGLSDPATRALVKIIGLLKPMPATSQEKVLRDVAKAYRIPLAG